RQRQWQFRPALGLSLNPVSDISIGPIVRYTATDSLGNRFIAATRPYGFTKFGQAGLQLRTHYETRYISDTLKPRAILDFVASGYPGMWDVTKRLKFINPWPPRYLRIPI